MNTISFENKRQALLVEIHEAFDSVEYPGDEFISGTQDELELEDFKFEKSVKWFEIPEDLIDYHYDGLSAFSALGYRFFLPCYMAYALKTFLASRLPSLDWVISNLTYPFSAFATQNYGFADEVFRSPLTQDDLVRHHYKQQSLLDIKQLEVIKKFLQFVEEFYDDKEDTIYYEFTTKMLEKMGDHICLPDDPHFKNIYPKAT